jgi:hypothetical protein
MSRLGALVLLGAALGRADVRTCAQHSDCAENQYCSDYTGENGIQTVACYACVDAYRFTCTEYGDSVDQSCAQCVEEEAANGDDAYNYINCESHASCADSQYCYTNNFDGFVVQDCWPCQDPDGKTCDYYGDAFDGDCAGPCANSVPTTSGCTTHADCAPGLYCSSYTNTLGTQQIVTCNPCLDSYDYSCQDYADSVDHKCDVCDGAEGASAVLPSSDDAYCQNPTAETQIAFQLCSSHADCRKSEYCSAYKGTAGCVIDCWPCTDMYSLSCTDYGDSIDGSCAQCSANSSRVDPPAVTPECQSHADCTPTQFCSAEELCKPCASCEVRGGRAARSLAQLRVRPRANSCPTRPRTSRLRVVLLVSPRSQKRLSRSPFASTHAARRVYRPQVQSVYWRERHRRIRGPCRRWQIQRRRLANVWHRHDCCPHRRHHWHRLFRRIQGQRPAAAADRAAPVPTAASRAFVSRSSLCLLPSHPRHKPPNPLLLVRAACISQRMRAKYGPDDKLTLRHNPRAMREREETEAS